VYGLLPRKSQFCRDFGFFGAALGDPLSPPGGAPGAPGPTFPGENFRGSRVVTFTAQLCDPAQTLQVLTRGMRSPTECFSSAHRQVNRKPMKRIVDNSIYSSRGHTTRPVITNPPLSLVYTLTLTCTLLFHKTYPGVIPTRDKIIILYKIIIYLIIINKF